MTGMGETALKALRTMAAQSHGKLEGRSTTARLTIHGDDLAGDILVPAIRAWAEAMFTGRPGARIMVSAWHGAQRDIGRAGLQQATVKGATSAYLAAVARIGWRSTAPHLVTAIDGSLINLMTTAPRIVGKWAEDDLASAAAARSRVAEELNDLSGALGYGVGLDRPTEGAILLGQCGNAAMLREGALGGTRLKWKEKLVPWFEPLRMLVKSARKTKDGYGVGLRSAVALAEGGWRTQLHICAEGKASHPYCCSCGPFTMETVRQGPEEQGAPGGEEGERSMREALSHIDWGLDKQGESEAGCKVGSLVHKVVLCARNQEVHGQAALKTINKLRDWFNENPWDPLWWRGVPAVPAIPQAPTFQEYVLRRSVMVDLVARGMAHTDGACRGLLRRTKRAGWGACCVSEEGEILWAVYGVCPDASASATWAELWGLLGILRYALPPLSIGTDNAEVVRRWECGPL